MHFILFVDFQIPLLLSKLQLIKLLQFVLVHRLPALQVVVCYQIFLLNCQVELSLRDVFIYLKLGLIPLSINNLFHDRELEFLVLHFTTIASISIPPNTCVFCLSYFKFCLPDVMLHIYISPFRGFFHLINVRNLVILPGLYQYPLCINFNFYQ